MLESSIIAGEFINNEDDYDFEEFDYCSQEMKELVKLWVEFNSLIPEHDKLMEIWKKKTASKKNKKSLRPKTRSFMKEEFPRITFLRKKSLEQAVEYIYDLSPSEMRDLIKLIKKEKEDGIFYHSMVEWIRSSRFTILHADMPCTYLHKKGLYEKSKEESSELLKEDPFFEIRKKNRFENGFFKNPKKT